MATLKAFFGNFEWNFWEIWNGAKDN